MIFRHDVYHKDLLKALFRDEFSPTALPSEVTAEKPLAFFTDFVNFNFALIAKRFGCEIILHSRRTEEAFDAWHEDLKHKPNRVHESVDLDPYKRAGFLCYWLRRRNVVDEIRPDGTDVADPKQMQKTELFAAYGNELCSFYLGYQFCLRFAFTQNGGGAETPLIHASVMDAERIQSIKLDGNFQKEIAICLKFKNMSPHALYIIYKSLFSSI